VRAARCPSSLVRVRGGRYSTSLASTDRSTSTHTRRLLLRHDARGRNRRRHNPHGHVARRGRVDGRGPGEMTEDGRPVGCRGREEPHRVYFPQADSLCCASGDRVSECSERGSKRREGEAHEEAKLADDVDDLLLEERLRLACGRSRLLGLGRSLEWRESCDERGQRMNLSDGRRQARSKERAHPCRRPSCR